MRASLFFLCLVLLLSHKGNAKEPEYRPEKITDLIKTGAAKDWGGGFSGGWQQSTHLWKDSENHHVFFFRLNDVSYGEFRDEVLSEGRFLTVFEKFLVNDYRKRKVLSKAKDLRFVCKETEYIWKDNVCLTQQVRWWFLTTDLNGKVLKKEAVVKQEVTLSVVSVILPGRVTPQEKNFFVVLHRKSLTPHELAFGYGPDRDPVFGSRNPVVEYFGVTNGRCSLWARWPKDHPKLIGELHETIPNPPGDANPSLRRSKKVGSMTINMDPPRNTPFVFIPDKN